MQTSNSSPGTARSLLTPIGYQAGDCGYCKADDTSQRTPHSRASYYARAKTLSPEHYQELMDRGWRRSGVLLYMPDASRSCCPHYTIRLLASEFRANRNQRQALNRWNRFVLGDEYIREAKVKFAKSKEEKKHEASSFDLLSTLHESETSQLKPGIEPAHRFEVKLEPAEFSEEKFAVFDNYQRHVHKEGDADISKTGFKRFLCSSPLTRRTGADGKKLGSFHQCYYLDDRLVAMSVLDLLPHGVSGVYFIYHSDFEKWSFGKLSALREAALAQEQNYQYYYMGYYIHGCAKMRYKGEYQPQYVLDFESLGWDPLDDEMKSLMERRKYASMSKERARKQRLDAKRSRTEVNGKSEQPGQAMTDDSSDTEDDIIPYPTPLEAMSSGKSMLELGVPGVMSLEKVHQEIDLDRMKVRIPGGIHEMRYIQSWASGSETDPATLKGVFAELAAALGPVVAREAVVDFT